MYTVVWNEYGDHARVISWAWAICIDKGQFIGDFRSEHTYQKQLFHMYTSHRFLQQNKQRLDWEKALIIRFNKKWLSDQRDDFDVYKWDKDKL